QQIAQEDHALAGVGGVAALREAADQFGKNGEGLTGSAGVAAGLVGGQEVAKKVAALGQGRKALDVIGVIDIGMARMEADKAIRSAHGGLVVSGAVVGVDQLQLRLLGIGAKRKLRFEALQVLDGYSPVARIEIALDNIVEEIGRASCRGRGRREAV